MFSCGVDHRSDFDEPAIRAAAAAILRAECLPGRSHALDCSSVTGFSAGHSRRSRD